jgi:hypothetical protein
MAEVGLDDHTSRLKQRALIQSIGQSPRDYLFCGSTIILATKVLIPACNQEQVRTKITIMILQITMKTLLLLLDCEFWCFSRSWPQEK